jgi:hypothetical protein
MILLQVVPSQRALRLHSHILFRSTWQEIADMQHCTAAIWIDQWPSSMSPGHRQPSPSGSRVPPVRVGAMETKHTGHERRPSPFVLALVVAGCLAVVVIGLCAPVARAELILPVLPGLIALAAAWLGHPALERRHTRETASRQGQRPSRREAPRMPGAWVRWRGSGRRPSLAQRPRRRPRPPPSTA